MSNSYSVVRALSPDTVSLGMGPVIELSARLLKVSKRTAGGEAGCRLLYSGHHMHDGTEIRVFLT